MRGERGQFYLIATIIIIAVIIGFAAISNYAQEQDSVKIYDLGEELNIEGENVLDHGIYNGLDQEETADLLQSFVENYSAYLGDDIDIYLLIGDDESIIVIGQDNLEDVKVEFGLTGNAIDNLKKFSQKTFKPKAGDYDGETAKNVRKVKIKIKDKENTGEEYEYEFELKTGENFYFIISQKIGEESHVTTN